MEWLKAALLGAIQGLTEFLPISSTAHLKLGERALGFEDPASVFTVTIQFGSILAIMWLYREKILSVMRGLPHDPQARRFALMLLLAVIPALLAGVLFQKTVKEVLHSSLPVIAWAFIAGGVVMLLVERFRPAPLIKEADQTPIARAIGIGLCQMLALIPGVSRSGATIVGGLLFRLDRAAAAEFSFFLAMPTMAAAFANDVWGIRHQLVTDQGVEILIGFVMAFVAAILVVRPFLRFVTRVGFAPFAWYRILAGAVLLVGLNAGWW